MSMVSNISFEQSTSDWPGRTMMIVKTLRLYRGPGLLIAINALRCSVASAADRSRI
jgi:hypothetical protein